MTVVRRECDNDSILRRSTPEIVLSIKNLNFSSKVANWIIVDILINLMLSLASTFITNGECQRSLYLCNTLLSQFQFENSLSLNLMLNPQI